MGRLPYSPLQRRGFSAKSSRVVEWKTVTDILDRNGFLLLFCGRINVASLPKQYFTEGQLAFVKAHGRT